MKKLNLLLPVAAVGCLFGDAPVGPSQAEAHGLNLLLTVQPESVLVGTNFTARVHIENPTAETVDLTSGSSCLAYLDVFKGSSRKSDEFDGSVYACLTVVTGWQILSGDSLIQEWTVQAGSYDGSIPNTGTYKLRVDFAVSPVLPRLEREFVVFGGDILDSRAGL